MCRDPEDAKDVLQDTLIAMARGVRDFRGASSLSTWLFTIARSFCIKKRRRSKFAQGADRSLETDVPPNAAELVDQGKNAEEALAGKQVEHALEQVPASIQASVKVALRNFLAQNA